MRYIIQYKAEDGQIFEEWKDCVEYEKLWNKIIKIKEILPDLNDLDSADGKLFYHKFDDFKKFKTSLVELVISELKKENEWGECEPMDIHPTGIICRILGDSNDPRIKLLNDLWHRLMCIDKDGVEYKQPYFVNGRYI